MARIGESQVTANAGSTLQNDLFTGPEGGVTYDYERRTIRLHDGQTAGGREIAPAAFRNVATSLSDPGDYLVPLSLLLNHINNVGDIKMWYGSEASIPTGWVLCNGLNGTPDLRNRFVVGAGGLDSGGEYLPGTTGGSSAPTTDFQGFHSHTAVTDPAGGHLHLGNTELNGNHIHGGNTTSAGGHDHALTIAASTAPHGHIFSMDTAAHTHSALSTAATVSVNHTHNAQANAAGAATQSVWIDTNPTGGLTIIAATGSTSPPAGRPFAINIPSNVHFHPTGNPVGTNDLDSHTHIFNPTPSPSGSHLHTATIDASDVGGAAYSTSHTHTGSAVTNGAHTHNISTDQGGTHLHSYTTNYEAEHVHLVSNTSINGNHQHTITNGLPPYMALCFIMYVGV